MIRYELSRDAASDLSDIWNYVESRSDSSIADRLIAEIRTKMVFLSNAPAVGHRRSESTHPELRYFAVYSYLIVYRPMTKPLQIVSILHGMRDIERILDDRL